MEMLRPSRELNRKQGIGIQSSKWILDLVPEPGKDGFAKLVINET